MDPLQDPAPAVRPPRQLDQVRDTLRTLHCSYRTEQQYVQWVRSFILFHDRHHPRTMGAPEVEAFVTRLAVIRKVSASTQNQALVALLFLYQEVLELPWPKHVVRMQPSRHVPIVLTHKEVRAVLARLEDEYWLIGSILHGGGLRLQEALQLRVKDLDFDLKQLVVRSGKDRVTILPEAIVEPLQRHLEVVRAQHSQAITRSHGGAVPRHHVFPETVQELLGGTAGVDIAHRAGENVRQAEAEDHRDQDEQEFEFGHTRFPTELSQPSLYRGHAPAPDRGALRGDSRTCM